MGFIASQRLESSKKQPEDSQAMESVLAIAILVGMYASHLSAWTPRAKAGQQCRNLLDTK